MYENKIKFKEWFSKKGKDFFIKNGVRQGFKVIEFGAGSGNYTIPLAQAVGPNGVVYAVESDHAKYLDIEKKLKKYSILNVVIYDTDGKIDLNIGSEFDFFIAYDVIHYFSNIDRKQFYKMAFNILKKEGIFSVLPKHRRGDQLPIGSIGNMELSEIKDEIMGYGFKYNSSIEEEIVHDDSFVFETVINFIK
jgi:predicted methyltransferase